MASTSALGEFLRARREQLRPDDFDLHDWGVRRVPGLRREEVAMLAGLSTDYYVRLEQGRNRHPSPYVVAALAEIFGLDEDAGAHLARLASPPAPRRPQPGRPERVTPGALRLLERWSDVPASIVGRHLDVLACTALTMTLHPGLVRERNLLRLIFLDPDERDVFADWERAGRDSVAWLRANTGGNQDDPKLTALVGELFLKSADFGRLWRRHDVRNKAAGTKRLRHPVVGDLDLEYETLSVNAASGQSLIVYHARPGSGAAATLALLSSHAATSEQQVPGDPTSMIVVGARSD